MRVYEIDIKSYDQAVAFLANGNGFVRKLAHNTYLVLRGSHVELTYHGHSIARFYQATEISVAHVTVDNWGYFTSTTKQRLNCVIPSRYRIYQRNFNWYVHDGMDESDMPYHNGMAFKTP